MKLIMENWRKFVEQEQPTSDKEKLENAWNQFLEYYDNYETLVNFEDHTVEVANMIKELRR